MKVAINCCFGGFSLSREAQAALAATDCPHMRRYEPREYYGERPGWEAKFEEDMARAPGCVFGPPLVIDGKIITDEHRSDGRSCPRLIEVVERLGAAANGGYAKIKIVEIPDDISFEIDEYDGMESIHESNHDLLRKQRDEAIADAYVLAHAYKHDTRPPTDVVQRSIARRPGLTDRGGR